MHMVYPLAVRKAILYHGIVLTRTNSDERLMVITTPHHITLPVREGEVDC
jgi:hypothetical protein